MAVRSLIFLILVSLLQVRCEQSKINYTLFENGKALGTNKNKRLEEASGLVASRRHPGYLWTHNDSGHPPELFLLNEQATTEKVFAIAQSKNRDWEDMTMGRGPEENVDYLYVGDIGDNVGRYPVKYIYRVKEPSPDSETVGVFDTLIVKLAGEVRDTETLMSDPLTNNLYLVSKREDSVSVYEVRYPFTGDTLLATRIARLDLKSIVSGDISPDGKEVLLKNYKHIYYWKRQNNESLAELLTTPATELPYVEELLGEAIAWAGDGSGFYTLGENGKGERAKLFFYKRK